VTGESTGRTYRFAPLARSGVMLGLSGLQCTALGFGVLGSGLLLNLLAHPALVVLPLMAGAVVAFAPVAGRPMHEWAPIAVRWAAVRLTGGTTWFGRIPTFTVDGRRGDGDLDLPPALAGLRVDESDASWARRGRNSGAAVIRDRRQQTVSATLRVRGREFSLCERSEQERLLQLWGDALAGFCRERGAVGRIRWTEWAAPAGHDEQLAYLDANRYASKDSTPAAIYRELLEQAGPMATRHETLVTVTVEQRRIRRRRHDQAPPADEVLLEEVRLLVARLESAGLQVDAPLSPSEIAAVLRSRLDPYSTPGIAGRRSLANLVGISAANAGPMAQRTAWDHVTIDRAVHAAYVVAEWPRLDVPANWMEPLLLHAGGIRTMAMLYEPVGPSRSQRQIDRDSTRLATDEEQRSRTGFRIGARHRRAQGDVASREAELVAGYAELEYIGVMVVTAPDLAALERSCAEYEQVAAQCGIELRRLDGRHDLAIACALPVGRGIEPRRFAW
jgi:hypothetical protein